MHEAPIPISEAARLETIRALKILDTDPEESFDRLARLASAVFAAPIAHVSLIDEHREWFKATCGVEDTEGDRRTAFCAHTILSSEPLIVEDTLEDERFCDNPKVIGDGIRFYAGAPLITRSGLAVGALCVKDRKPRRFTPEQVEILEQLAQIAVEGMEHRLAEAELRRWQSELRRSEERLARVLESAMDAIIIVDADGKVTLFNRAAEDLFRCPAREAVGHPFSRFSSAKLRELLDNCRKALTRRGTQSRYMW